LKLNRKEEKMSDQKEFIGRINRRSFLRDAGGALAAGVIAAKAATPAAHAQTETKVTPEPITNAGAMRPLTDSEKVERIASNTYPIRWIFKNRGNVGDKATVAKMQAKYGTITMLDFPAFTKKTFPGVTKMDLWSSLFGDVDDPSQLEPMTVPGRDGQPR
jgi:hypothetical protein